MSSAPDTIPHDSLTLQQVVTVINQSVVVALNIKLIERTNRIWAELQDLSRDYNGWTYGTLRDGEFTCGVRVPSALAHTLTPGQIGWWTGTFETVARSRDSRGRLSQYDAWRFVVRTFDGQGVSERMEKLRQAEIQLTQEGILTYHPFQSTHPIRDATAKTINNVLIHRPHPRPETDKGSIKSIRRFLTETGVTPDDAV